MNTQSRVALVFSERRDPANSLPKQVLAGPPDTEIRPPFLLEIAVPQPPPQAKSLRAARLGRPVSDLPRPVFRTLGSWSREPSKQALPARHGGVEPPSHVRGSLALGPRWCSPVSGPHLAALYDFLAGQLKGDDAVPRFTVCLAVRGANRQRIQENHEPKRSRPKSL